MANSNKSFRIRTKVGREADTFLDVHLEQDYDSLEILSLKLSDKDVYKLHNSDYGVIVGRVLANGNFGVPNAKISVFIAADEQNSDMHMWNLYPYSSTSTKNDDDIRYNLLPDESVKDCHKAVGTFPHKTYLLENDAYLEVFDKYYVYTTRTNAAGDYLICGVPTGMQTIHMDLDLSDCGILSQRPRDFVYKGYTIEQFENPNQFKKDENLDGLSQIFSQNQPVYVKPFWGNEDNGDEIGITRADIEISFKFEPTCVFMGSAISDNASNGVGKKCVPTNQMGAMDELTAGEGTIEMIRKTPGGNVEEFSIKGNQLINGNGVWCYQIPMNLDYMMTDEYGNMVPTDDPEKGIPTRTRVRFRASLTDMDGSSQSYYRAKYLIPNNPRIEDTKVDYNFGTYTEEDSYRDLFWNGVYTIKSYIPRFQKSKRWKNERFSGIKACNYYGNNNPMPYNNLRIKLPFMFTVLCIFVKLFIKIVTLVNRLQAALCKMIIGWAWIGGKSADQKIKERGLHCTFIGDGLCPDMEGWYFAPGCANGLGDKKANALYENTLAAAMGNGTAPDGVEDKSMINSSEFTDETSTDKQNMTKSEEDTVCLTMDVDYLVNCFEMNLANEYRVIKFDFYNDWVNGVLYFPRWMRKIKRKKKYKFSLSNGLTSYYKDKVQGCMNSENSRVKKSRYYTQQCSLGYTGNTNQPWTRIGTPPACNADNKSQQKKKSKQISIFPARCHKKKGMHQSSIFGKKSGLVTEETTMLGQFVYYLKPCEWKESEFGTKRTLLFATDIVLLGTLNDCDENGIPQAFKYLNNTSYIMPTNLALTTMDDDSYIYSTDKGTVCSSSKDKMSVNPRDPLKSFQESARRITPNYETTHSAYTRTEDDQVDYGENDDPIAVTEAAGISWNYSGPGQDDVNAGLLEKPADFINRLYDGGNKKFKYLYYPGGHFLGLSCVNSETNIKSCVNLKRICEMGATMSQRREELRGYDQNDGTPKYRYYVPTGLITNVDIEGAAFRSMFATLNHNKLVATDVSETTGYKKYSFRFLRPDGFDGALADYVHMTGGSPYNRVVNNSTNLSAVTDASGLFRRIFPTWTPPDDYDPDETKYTETRTIEDTIDDYYMFRFGLDGFSDKEQRDHYLVKYAYGYSLPQYENSFYFYFGLKDGSTALDEFKKQFFSECESNKIMKAPVLNVMENITETLDATATLLIDNMLAPYNVVIKDNSAPESSSNPATITTNNDFVNFGNGEIIDVEIGHEYTITVTDSLDQTAQITFVFGSSAVKTFTQTVHFRKSGNTQTNDARLGGFIKINDEVTILKQNFKISDGAITFKYKNIATGAEGNLTSSQSYVDASGEKWFLYHVPCAGQYEIYANYNGSSKEIAIYNTTVEDNSNVELYVGCDYLGYKSGRILSGITETEWMNGSVFTGTTYNDWLMRHTFYRQTQNDNAGYDSYIYTKAKNSDVAIFCQAEKGGLKPGYEVSPGVYNKSDYSSYPGMSIDETWSFVPTMYWDGDMSSSARARKPFDAMAYTNDGRAAADANTNITITNVVKNGNNLEISYSGSDQRLLTGHGCVVVFENGVIVTPVVTSSSLMIAYNAEDPYPSVNTEAGADKSVLFRMATVYPTLMVPVIYKPFFGEISAATWCLVGLTIERNDEGVPVVKRNNLPLSYKVEGTIHNGLTFSNKFFSGETIDVADEDARYETYLIVRNKIDFYNALTAETREDYKYDRTFRFGAGSTNDGYYREVDGVNESIEDVDKIEYAIMEGFPEDSVLGTNKDVILTGRYDGGFDLNVLYDYCSIEDSFYENLKIRAFTDDGIDGSSCIYADKLPNSAETQIFYTRENLFRDNGVLKVRESILSPVAYCYGYYNKNAAYDANGSSVQVLYTQNNYRFGKTQDNGTKIEKYVGSEAAANQEGVTLLHKFNIETPYKTQVSEITRALNNATEIFVGTQSGETIATNAEGQSVTQFPSGGLPALSNGGTIIAKYTRQDSGNRNKMVVYKLYPPKALEVVYPVEAIGLEPFISVPAEITCTYEAQEVSITVSTNVSYTVSSSNGWATVVSGPYTPATTTIKVSVGANQGPSTTNRSTTITFTSNENGVTQFSRTCTLTQLKDDMTPVHNEAMSAQSTANSAQSTASSAQSTANNASTKADDAQTTADEALAIANAALECCESSDNDSGD